MASSTDAAVDATVEAAVTKPFALTVITGVAVADPNCPTLLFTVAKVIAPVTFPAPVKEADVQVPSPVIPIVLPVSKAVAVAALPVVDPEDPLAFPVKFAVIVPAEKLPLPSLSTSLEAVLALVAPSIIAV